MPGWAKVAAVVVAVALVAVGNVAAKNRQDKRELAAQDRVALDTGLSSVATETEVQVVLSVHNKGDRELQLSTPSVTAPGVELVPQDDFPVALAGGATRVFIMRLHPPCLDGRLLRVVPTDASVQLPVEPQSGTARVVSVAFTEVSLAVLASQGCGRFTADRSVIAGTSDVTLEKYAVSYTLSVKNDSPESVQLLSLIGPSLAMSVEGGLPIDVAAFDDLRAPARLSIPACALLPSELDPGRGAQPYIAFHLQLLFEHGRRLSLPVELRPGEPMLEAIRALARDVCPPGSYRSGATGRRGGGVR